ncbi:MAG: acyloxyacyl hydrolase [Bacteroidales bacterium]|nr:acyloxyacyl hydrolase [Bacteroidales bacterium]
MNRLLLFLLLAIPLGISAQDTTLSLSHSHWQLGINASYAMPNNFDMMEYSRGTFGFDVTWFSRQSGNEYWRLRKHYPAFGIRGSFACIPNAIYGHRFGLAGIVQAPLGRLLDYHIGLGLSSYTRPQSITHDPDNIFISSVVNCLIDVGFDLRLGDRYLLSASLLHSSNGMLLFPNKGLNFLQFGAAVKLGNEYERTLDWQHSRNLIDTATLIPPEFSIAFSPGTVMSRDTTFPGYYFCYDLALTYQRYASPTFAYGATIDFWYNFVDHEQLQYERSPYTLPVYLSALGTMEFFWGPLSIKAGIGFSIVSSPQVSTPLYERVGAYYNLRRVFLGVGINAHGGRIEFIEWTLGYRFPLHTH